METNQTNLKPVDKINFGHLAIIAVAALALLGITWMKKPDQFAFNKNKTVAEDPNAPHYYAYVTPQDDLPKPEVLGASTQEGPMVIGDDGTVQPVDMGEVLGASAQDVSLDLDNVQVKSVPDSDDAVKKYFSDSSSIESGPVDATEFAGALTSGDQTQINQQAQKFISLESQLEKLVVPASLVHLQKLKIIQYKSAIQLLQNFTQADNNPDLVNKSLQQFIKSQQDLDAENSLVAQKYGDLVPYAAAYSNPGEEGVSAVVGNP